MNKPYLFISAILTSGGFFSFPFFFFRKWRLFIVARGKAPITDAGPVIMPRILR